MISDAKATIEDAELMLELYELREDQKMREAWDWFAASFFPSSAGDVKAVMDPAHPHNAHFDAVTSYWDMAASFAANGALNAEIFAETAGEMLLLWAMIGRFAPQIRRDLDRPGFLGYVEKTVSVADAGGKRLRILGDANRKRRVVKEAREHLAIGWACSNRDGEMILRDYEAVCLNTQVGVASICNLEFAARHVIEKKLRGAFVECGTWRGGSLGYWARSFIRNGGDDSAAPLYGFDSFEGMPRMTAADGEKASQWLYGKQLSEVERKLIDGALVPTGANVASEAECRALVEASGYHKDSIHVIKGWFQDTLPVHKRGIGPIMALRLDGDLYEATRFCLETLYDAVLSRGVVIIDDYEYFDGCRRAVDEFIAARDLNLDLIYYGDFGRFFFKP